MRLFAIPVLLSLFINFTLYHLGPKPALGKELIAGPVTAKVIKVRDGDSLEAIAHIWPGHHITIAIRIRGIDAPELKGRCTQEVIKAHQARKALVRLIGEGSIKLTTISGGKYFGRILAHVETQSGKDVTSALLKTGLVRPYRGKNRASWCPSSTQS